MKLLQEISDQSLGLGERGAQIDATYRLRKSARAVLLNARGEMAIQYLETHNFHKLPGGGVEGDETVEAALAREIREEVGCALTIERPLGIVIEYRNEQGLLHISYGFSATVVGEVGAPTLEERELEEGLTTLWVSPQEALQRLEADTQDVYKAGFILARERAILRAYLEETTHSVQSTASAR